MPKVTRPGFLTFYCTKTMKEKSQHECVSLTFQELRGLVSPPTTGALSSSLLCQRPLSPSPQCHGLLPSSAPPLLGGNVKPMGCLRPCSSSGIPASQPASLPQSPISYPLQNHGGHLPIYSSTQEQSKAPCCLELKIPVG